MLIKKSILKKTLGIGILSVISRTLGIIKDILRVRFLGIGAMSDAFSVAYKIPNLLRKSFAGGALSVAFIPTLVKLFRDDKDIESDRVISGLLLINSALALVVCLLIIVFPKFIIFVTAGGFLDKPAELCISIKLIKILVFFTFFTSIGSILSGAMQAKSYFTPTGLGPVVINVIHIIMLIISQYFSLSVYNFALLLLLGTAFQALFFLCFYLKLGFRFRCPDIKSYEYIKEIIFKFLPCILSISAMKINILIDERFGSTLSSGTYTIIDISFRFMAMILHAIGSNFALVLLPYLSGVPINAKEKLNFYIFQIMQFVIWLIIPTALITIFFSYDLIYTVFYKFSGSRFTLINVTQASNLLIGYSLGLIFYSINKVLLNTYYSLNNMYLPAIVVAIGAGINIILNFLFIGKLGAFGLAVATSIAAAVQTILFVALLKLKLHFNLYLKKLLSFCLRYIAQLFFVSSLFYLIYNIIYHIIDNYFSTWLKIFLLKELGLWLWISPLILLLFVLLYKTPRIFGIKIYFLS